MLTDQLDQCSINFPVLGRNANAAPGKVNAQLRFVGRIARIHPQHREKEIKSKKSEMKQFGRVGLDRNNSQKSKSNQRTHVAVVDRRREWKLN